jgi:SAM-dependent methyltransferase
MGGKLAALDAARLGYSRAMDSMPLRLRATARRITSTVVPKTIRARLADVPIAQRLAGRRIVKADAFDERVHLRARHRWQAAEPEVGLTWGRRLSGSAFIAKLAEHASLSETTRLFEVGPGYGRLVESLLQSGLPFASYVGLDLSESNVEHLQKRFGDPRLTFLAGDVEGAPIPDFDVGYSSLTLKHLYPTFEAAARNIASSLVPGGRFIFDAIEGTTSFFEYDELTFVRRYERREIEEILDRTGMDVAAWDIVKHDDDIRHDRLLVVATRR